jgi:hypothetical protein
VQNDCNARSVVLSSFHCLALGRPGDIRFDLITGQYFYFNLLSSI